VDDARSWAPVPQPGHGSGAQAAAAVPVWVVSGAAGGAAVVVVRGAVVVAGGAGAAVVVGELHPATARLAIRRAVASGRLGRMVTPGAGAPRLERLVISLDRVGHKSRSGLSRQRSRWVSVGLLGSGAKISGASPAAIQPWRGQGLKASIIQVGTVLTVPRSRHGRATQFVVVRPDRAWAHGTLNCGTAMGLTNVEPWLQLGAAVALLVSGIVGRRDGPDHQVHPPEPSDPPADPDDLTTAGGRHRLPRTLRDLRS
jgi:hypothetical protein